MPSVISGARFIFRQTVCREGELLAQARVTIALIGEDGRPRFDLVQQRDPSRHPAVFQVFDVLSIGGTDTVELPYVDRRRLLADYPLRL